MASLQRQKGFSQYFKALPPAFAPRYLADGIWIRSPTCHCLVAKVHPQSRGISLAAVVPFEIIDRLVSTPDTATKGGKIQRLAWPLNTRSQQKSLYIPTKACSITASPSHAGNQYLCWKSPYPVSFAVKRERFYLSVEIFADCMRAMQP